MRLAGSETGNNIAAAAGGSITFGEDIWGAISNKATLGVADSFLLIPESKLDDLLTEKMTSFPIDLISTWF
jgi:hypothetical protein